MLLPCHLFCYNWVATGRVSQLVRLVVIISTFPLSSGCQFPKWDHFDCRHVTAVMAQQPQEKAKTQSNQQHQSHSMVLRNNQKSQCQIKRENNLKMNSNQWTNTLWSNQQTCIFYNSKIYQLQNWFITLDVFNWF